MKRTTISLDEDLAFALAREARRSQTSASEVARTALRSHLGLDGKRRRIGFAALGRSSDDRSVAEGGDEKLFAEIMEERVARRVDARRDS